MTLKTLVAKSQAAKNQTEQPIKIATQSRKPGPPRIVIVDDELDTCQVWEALIRTKYKEATVLLFGDGRAAWQELSQTDPDLLITDIMRPNFTAFDMLPLLSKKRVQYPVQIISGALTEENQKQLCEPAGPNLNVSFLKKSCSPETFLNTLAARLKAV